MALNTYSDKFIEEYLNLEKKSECTIRIFQKNENLYCCLEEDAILASKIIYNNDNQVKKNFFSNYPSISIVYLKQSEFENLICQLILVKCYRVELWKDSIKTNGCLLLSGKASPGNYELFEDIIYSARDFIKPHVIISVITWLESSTIKIGLCCLDFSLWTIEVTEFVESDSLTIFESVLLQKSPCECLIPTESGYIYKKIQEICNKNSCFVTKANKNHFDSMCFKSLDNILSIDSVILLNRLILQQKYALSCANSLIKYKEISNQSKSFKLLEYNPFDYMILDKSALLALTIFDQTDFTSKANSKFKSLYSVLNNCETSAGKRLLYQWLHQPLLNKSMINERFDAIEIFINNQITSNLIKKEILKSLPDINQLTRRISNKKSSLKDCVRLYQVLLKIKKLIVLMKKLRDSSFVSFNNLLIEPLIDLFEDIEKYCILIEKTVDFDIEPGEKPRIKSTIDPALTDLKSKINEIIEKIQAEHEHICSILDKKNKKIVKLEIATSGKYVFRVTLKDSCVLKSEKHWTILESHANGVQFETNKLALLSKEIVHLDEQYEIIQSNIVKNIIEVTETYTNLFNTIGNIVGQVDVFVSLAYVCYSSPKPYIRPIIKDYDSRVLKLREARHPLVEKFLPEGYIANDTHLEIDGERFLIITGPNMGGKSTYIRMIGAIQILCQIGCFVPCKYAEISIVDRISTRIGSSDHFSMGLSTFMTEMIDVSNILKLSTERSLVIIDELGRGTSTYDGFGLACSIANTLLKDTKCFVLFATHYHEITDVFNNHVLSKYVSNKHMEALIENNHLTLTYRLLNGCCKKSYGINVAIMAQLPQEIVEDATFYLKKLESNYDDEESDDKEKLRITVENYLKSNSSLIKEMSNQQLFDSFFNIYTKS